MQRWSTSKTYAIKVAGKTTMGRVAIAISAAMIKDVESYWIGRVQKMQRKVQSK